MLGRACREARFRQGLSETGKGLVYRRRSTGQDRLEEEARRRTKMRKQPILKHIRGGDRDLS